MNNAVKSRCLHGIFFIFVYLLILRDIPSGRTIFHEAVLPFIISRVHVFSLKVTFARKSHVQRGREMSVSFGDMRIIFFSLSTNSPSIAFKVVQLAIGLV